MKILILVKVDAGIDSPNVFGRATKPQEPALKSSKIMKHTIGLRLPERNLLLGQASSLDESERVNLAQTSLYSS